MTRTHAATSKLTRLPVCISSDSSIDVSRVHSDTQLLGDHGRYSVVVVSCLRLYSVDAGRIGQGQRRRITRTAHGTGLLTGRLRVPIILLDRLGHRSRGHPKNHPRLTRLHRDKTVRRSTSVIVLLCQPTVLRVPASHRDNCPARKLNITVITGRHGKRAKGICFKRGRSVAGFCSCIPPVRCLGGCTG